MKKSILILSMAVLAVIIYSCKSEKTSTTTTTKETTKAELQCSKERLTYEVNIKPILAANCIGCHGDEKPAHGVVLTNYTAVKMIADKGEISCVLTSPDCPKMPPGKSITEEEKNKILCWVKNGSPEK